jgi:SMI1-KNR4 cell-wall
LTSADINAVHKFVDNGLDELRRIDLMRLPHPNMPLEMRDETIEADDDWMPWKAIESTVSDIDIKTLEEGIHLKVPDLYVEFLRYKHFYELPPVEQITFLRHGIKEWKEELFDYYFNYWTHTEIIDKGYIPFADFSDVGVVCFNTNKQNKEDNDCEIVMFDHDDIGGKPNLLYSSFREMMHYFLGKQEKATKTRK